MADDNDAELLEAMAKVPPHEGWAGKPTELPTREVGQGSREMAHVADIALVCHEANRAYCISIGDFTQLPWMQAPAWAQQSAINGVKMHLDRIRQGVEVTPRESHESWLAEKEREGWTYGTVKNPGTKQHPCMVPYDALPDAQKRKDVLFGAIVKALAAPL